MSEAERRRKQALYDNLWRRVEAVLREEKDAIVWMSTIACLIREVMGFFWVGFYRVKAGELLIGPYQGTLGCLRISFSRGVCGACATRRETIVVPDVSEFPGHVSCDSRSRSEIAVPVFDSRRELMAVLDIDSDRVRAFDDIDSRRLEDLAVRMETLEWTGIS